MKGWQTYREERKNDETDGKNEGMADIHEGGGETRNDGTGRQTGRKERKKERKKLETLETLLARRERRCAVHTNRSLSVCCVTLMR